MQNESTTQIPQYWGGGGMQNGLKMYSLITVGKTNFKARTESISNFPQA